MLLTYQLATMRQGWLFACGGRTGRVNRRIPQTGSIVAESAVPRRIWNGLFGIWNKGVTILPG